MVFTFVITDSNIYKATTVKPFVKAIKLLTIWESDEFTTGSVIVFHIWATPYIQLLWFIIFIFCFLKQHFLLVAHSPLTTEI